MLIAINRHLIDKASKEDITKYHGRFENRDLDAASLAAEIKSGHAFCAQHKSGGRRTSGFIAAGYLAVDIDHGLTLEAARADDYFQKYATILYTTPSHKEDKHRFRVVFELEEPIDDAERMAQALTGLTARFGGDKSCTDPCRMFYGSTTSSPEVHDRKLPPAEVEELVVRGQERRILSDSVGSEDGQRRSPTRSRINIPNDTTVRTERGPVVVLRDLPSRTRIFCPQHLDSRPSAMTLRNKFGNPGFYCSACVATFFLDDGSGRRSLTPYRFDYHWQSILDVSYEEYTTHADDDGHVNIAALRGGDIRVLNQRHLAFDEMIPVVVPAPRIKLNRDGTLAETSGLSHHFDMPAALAEGLIADKPLTLVRSPKGTGKTEWLSKLVQGYREQGIRVLLIGHRRALISATSHRIGLTSYLEDATEGADGPRVGVPPTPHYAICVDSLPRMDPRVDCYDVVLIDEVEQVFAHLLSDTLKEDRREALHTLRHYLKNAKALYVLDADLSSVTIELLHAVFGDDSPEYRAIVNQWQPSGRVVQLYDDVKFDHLAGELAASVQRHERCFVCSNSKKLIEELHGGLQRHIARPLRTLVVTSDNSQNADIQAIIRDIKVRALDYDVIFTSPALGTGIDITFEDDAQHIDTVFGFFRARINTHFDIDQQLARVRNPKRICVWISREEFRFETDSEAIKAELLASEAQHQRFLRIEADGTKVYDRDEFYETIYSEVTAAQRASKNRLRHNFIQLRNSNGWAVELVGGDADLTRSGKAVASQGKEERRRDEFERVLHARQLTPDEYDDLRRAEQADRIKDAEKPALRRFEIESFYLHDATLALLEEDGERNLRNSIAAYETLMATDDELRRRDQFAESRFTSDKPQHLLRKNVLRELLQKGHVMRSGAFDREALIDASMLGEFASYCYKSKAQLERLFEMSVRGSVRKDPIRQLQAVLKLLGLSLVKGRRDQSGGTSKSLYRLQTDRLDIVERWANRRSDADLREEWNRRRGASKYLPENESDAPSIATVSNDPLDRL